MDGEQLKTFAAGNMLAHSLYKLALGDVFDRDEASSRARHVRVLVENDPSRHFAAMLSYDRYVTKTGMGWHDWPRYFDAPQEPIATFEFMPDPFLPPL
jgi:hypothetical protein